MSWMAPIVRDVAGAPAAEPEFAAPPHAVSASAALRMRAAAAALGPNFIVGSFESVERECLRNQAGVAWATPAL